MGSQVFLPPPTDSSCPCHSPRPKRQCTNLTMATPFGVPAVRVSPHGFADSAITFGLRGPHFDPAGYDCWLSAGLALLLTIEPFRDLCLAVHDQTMTTTSPLFSAVAELVCVWVRGDQSRYTWRQQLRSAYNHVWRMFQEMGYSFGGEHSPCDVVVRLLSDARLAVSDAQLGWWTVLP